MSEVTSQGQCPMHEVRRIPNDGTPTCPSPTFAIWREEPSSRQIANVGEGHVGVPSLGILRTSCIGHCSCFVTSLIELCLHH